MLESPTPWTERQIDVAEPFQHFIDDYLAYLYEAHPTSATLDGNHVHDDLLDDLSRTAIDSHAGALAGFGRRLQAIPTEGLGPVEQVEHRIVRANIESRQFEVEGIRSWERDPHYYGQILAASLAPQALFAFASETDRARRVLSKLRQVPRLVQAARDNVKDPPPIFVKTGIDTFNGVVTFIDADLPRAFAGIDDMHLLADLADASAEATQALSAYAQWLETEVRPKAKASFRLGRERFERKLELDEGLSYSCERLLLIAERELARPRRRSACWPVASTAATLSRRGERRRAPTRARSADCHRARTGRRAQDVPGPQWRARRAGRRRRAGGAEPGLPALVGGQPVDARPVRDRHTAATYYLTDACARGPRIGRSNTCAT